MVNTLMRLSREEDMEKITQECVQDISPQTEREIASPLPLRQPFRHYDTMTSFPKIFTFKAIVGSPSSVSKWKKNADLVEDEKPEKQNTKLIAAAVTESPHAERCFLLEKDEQPLVPESDKLSSYPPDDAGGALTESHTSQGADTASRPDCKRLGESLEDKSPGGCVAPTANGNGGSQMQNGVGKIQEVRGQPGTLHGMGFCKTQSQSVGESSQERREHEFTENIRFSEEKGDAVISLSDYAAVKSFYSNPEENPSGNSTEGVKNEDEILELEICENQNGETKVQGNDTTPCKNTVISAAECAEASIVSYHVASASINAFENAGLEAYVFCEAEGGHTVGKTIAKAQSEMPDHTTETLLARISQEAAGGDNDVSPFCVIDPAIRSETDREAAEKHCYPERTAGAELSPSVEVCEMEMPLPLCPDVRPSQEVSAPSQTWQFNHQSMTQQCRDEKEDLCQSYIEPQACSISTNKTRTDSEGSCLWKSCPSSSPKSPPAGAAGQESYAAVGHRIKEQDGPGCFPVRLGHQKTEEEVEYLKGAITGINEAAEMSEREEGHSEDGTDEHKLEERLQQSEKRVEDSAGNSFDGCKLANVGTERSSDHQYCAAVQITEGTAEEKETDDGHQQQRPHKADVSEASPDDWISEWTEGNMSKSGSKLTLVSQHEQGNDAKTLMFDNKDDLLALAFPATSDAVVPRLLDLIPPQHVDNNLTASNISPRFSPSPVTYFVHTAGRFDTFEKIHLSLDDEGLGNSPLLTSQLHHCMPEAESSKYKEAPEEEGEVDMEFFTCDAENIEPGFLTSEFNRNELPNLISAAAAAFRQPDGESACSSSKRLQEDFSPQSLSSTLSPDSDVNQWPEFEMKKQFNKVLKELRLYFEISMSDAASGSRASLPGQRSDVAQAAEDDVSNCKQQLRDASSDDADEDPRLDMCLGDPALCPGGGGGEQEVPLGSRLCQESAAEEHREPQQMKRKRKMWSPSFMCLPLSEQLSHRPPPQQHRRLEPLRTCTGPIRVGLSKRAKTKHLHRPPQSHMSPG